MRVSVIGLGKLGACMAAAFAAKGFQTIGVDVNPQTVESLNQKRAPVFEPGLEELLQKVEGRLRATQDYQDAVLASDVSFIIVPTPSNQQGAFSLKYVREAAKSIGDVLRHKSSYHLVVVTSTVLPGSTEYGILPVLEKASGKTCGSDFGLCYSPEFIALGSVIRDFLTPDFALIGEYDERSGDVLETIYRDLFENNPPIARMSIVNAELTKIALNTYVTTKITFANMLAEICENLPGGDVDVVTSALGLDSRIGPKYLKGALGYGGTCFPRDNVALSYFIEHLGLPADLPRTVDRLNRRQARRVAELALAALPNEQGTVAVLGLSFKPGTNVVEESQGVEIAHILSENGRRVMVYDPVAMGEARKVLDDRVEYAPSVEACLERADVVVITVPWAEFSRIENIRSAKSPVVIDGWRLLTSNSRPNYTGIGIGGENKNNTTRLREIVNRIIAADEA